MTFAKNNMKECRASIEPILILIFVNFFFNGCAIHWDLSNTWMTFRLDRLNFYQWFTRNEIAWWYSFLLSVSFSLSWLIVYLTSNNGEWLSNCWSPPCETVVLFCVIEFFALHFDVPLGWLQAQFGHYQLNQLPFQQYKQQRVRQCDVLYCWLDQDCIVCAIKIDK